MLDALTWLSDNLEKLNNKNIVLFCDNKYVVNIANALYKTHRRHKILATKIQQKIFHLNQRASVEVLWLPAHCDIKLHDVADTLAVQGADSESLVNVTDISNVKVKFTLSSAESGNGMDGNNSFQRTGVVFERKGPSQ